MIRILIADDHAIVREGLKQIVRESSDMVVAGEAANGHEVMDLVRNQQDWDLVLLDIAMPGRGGIDTLRQLKHERPNLPVLILSIHPEDQYAVRALKDGASGYLTKESAPDELLVAIRKAAQGRKYVSASLAEKLVLNLENQGTVVTVHTEIPFGDVVVSSVFLNDVQIDSWKADNRGNFVAKFVMSAIKEIADPDPDAQPNLLTLVGMTDDEDTFSGEYEVRVVQIIPRGR